MVAWPENGATDWNTSMADFVDVGHDADGTHKKTQMLTDMGYDPTTLTALGSDVNVEFSLPNGLQVRMGKITRTGADTTVDYTDIGLSNFSNQCFQAFAVSGTNANVVSPPGTHTIATTGFQIQQADADDTVLRWIAFGY